MDGADRRQLRLVSARGRGPPWTGRLSGGLAYTGRGCRPRRAAQAARRPAASGAGGARPAASGADATAAHGGNGEGSPVKIAGMVVWVLTAGIGIYLLAAGIAAQRQLAGGMGAAGRTAAGGGTAAAGAVAAGGTAAPGGATAAQGSPLLEFTHPLLAVTGLTFWIFFVMTDDRLFARIALGVVVAAVLAGLSWVVISRQGARLRAARRAEDGEPGIPGHSFSAHLVMIHGLAATCTLALVVISAATAVHG